MAVVVTSLAIGTNAAVSYVGFGDDIGSFIMGSYSTIVSDDNSVNTAISIFPTVDVSVLGTVIMQYPCGCGNSNTDNDEKHLLLI